MDKINTQSVIAVTVTYGNRKKLLCEALKALQGLPLKRVVVVDNGATWPVKAEITEEYPDLVDVVELGKNTGSAGGFSTGIQRALDLETEFVWLLDDDNRPRKDTLKKLLKAWSYAALSTSHDHLAVVAFRPEHQADVAAGVPAHRINPRPNSFRGFHVLDIPYKIWRRTSCGRPRPCCTLPATVQMQQAPYSGLLFHHDVIHAIGLPNVDFVLYADDNDFTWRIHKLGGQIFLVTDALLDDLESSWNIKDRFGNGFAGMLKGAGDFRAYYGMRNGTYFDIKNLKKNTFIFWINYSAYMGLLYFFSRIYKKNERYRLLREAAKDGLSGRLGIKENFPL
jgi:GT2 family glycosyltransferase